MVKISNQYYIQKDKIKNEKGKKIIFKIFKNHFDYYLNYYDY